MSWVALERAVRWSEDFRLEVDVLRVFELLLSEDSEDFLDLPIVSWGLI